MGIHMRKDPQRGMAAYIGPRLLSKAALTVALTIGAGIVFKLVAFLRESYVASQFGLSPQTDAYFGFQQLPLTLSTFMLGSFCLAFAPAYAEARKRRESESGQWLSVIMAYLIGAGLLLTVLVISFTPILVNLFGQAGREGADKVLMILSLSFLPILFQGVWAGACIGRGQNVAAVVVGGLPYLMMAVFIAAFCQWRGSDPISLPISMTAGFTLVGCSCLFLLARREQFSICLNRLRKPFQIPGLRTFAVQLRGSSLENLGYAANQLLAIWFFSQVGPGFVSANNYAMRVGMLSFSLLSLPLAQLAQARLCAVVENEKHRVFVQYLGLVLICAGSAACLIGLFRTEIVSAIYLRGRFSAENLRTVVALLPAWLSYVVVMSLNGVLARYEFSLQQGSSYARRMWCAYLATNLLRFVLRGQSGPSWILWAAVLSEGTALSVGVFRRLSAARKDTPFFVPAPSQEAIS
jgi:putative peptidoglycan lipid II flippase